MAEKTRKVQLMLDKLVANHSLSKDGYDWLVCATDPFHDTEIDCRGFPDIASSKSVVQCITRTTNVTVPAGLATPTWDAHIFFLPCSQIYAINSTRENVLCKTLIDSNGYTLDNLTGPFLCPGLNIVTGNNGAAWPDMTVTNRTVGLDINFGAGMQRLVAIGWEVVDTTPVIGKQGSVTAYKSPNNSIESILFPADAATTFFPCARASLGALPPTTQNDAVLFPNSRTWQAQEGIYQVATLNETQNPYVSPVPGLCGFLSVPNTTQLDANTSRLCYVPSYDSSTALASQDPDMINISACNHPFPWDVSGCVFAGLNGTTGSLQVTVKYYVERIPTTTDQNLLVLCKSSPTYDPLAMEIYSRVVARLPCAVPVSENPLGEWFDTVMDVLGDVLPTIGNFFSPVFAPAGAIGNAAGAGAKALAKWNREERKNLKSNDTLVIVDKANGNGRSKRS